MRTPLRRAMALTGLTAVVVATGSIAAADGTSVQDITDRALATAPQAKKLAAPTEEHPEAVAGLDADRLARMRAAQGEDPLPAPRTREAPDRGDRSAATEEPEPAQADESGSLWRASWYGPGFHGNLTANGETYDQWAMTAAHKTLPFGTELRVTNVANGATVIVRINDRGPFVAGRDLDLSRAAAEALGFDGVATVRVEQL